MVGFQTFAKPESMETPEALANPFGAAPTQGEIASAAATDLPLRNLNRDLPAIFEPDADATLRNQARLGLMAPVKSPTLTAAEANRQYAIPGHLTFSEPVTDNVAKMMNGAKHDELYRGFVASRVPDTYSDKFAALGTQLGVSLLDPFNLGAAMMPGIGEERIAAFLGKDFAGTLAGRAAVRAGAGATSGATAMVPLTAMKYALSEEDGTEYAFSDALRDVAFGGVAGGVLHSAIGVGLDTMRELPEWSKLEGASIGEKEALFRGGQSLMAEARPVDLQNLYETSNLTQQGSTELVRQHLSDMADEQIQLTKEGTARGLTQSALRELKQTADEAVPIYDAIVKEDPEVAIKQASEIEQHLRDNYAEVPEVQEKLDALKMYEEDASIYEKAARAVVSCFTGGVV